MKEDVVADYRNHWAEDQAAVARAKQERETGWRDPSIFRSETTCMGCGCAIGDKGIHRQICPWPVEVGRHVRD